MNPSASGWIKKFGHSVVSEHQAFAKFEELYEELKRNGFIYGVHLDIFPFIKVEHSLTEDEVAKINLLSALYFTHLFETGEKDFKPFVETVFEYYQSLDVGNISFLNKILSGSHTDSQLEKLIDSRIYLGGNTFSRAFGNSITNSLLFVDVLIFQKYLNHPDQIMAHAQLLEYSTMRIVHKALGSKKTHETDAKLSQLLASSLTYIDLNETEFEGSYVDLVRKKFTIFEKSYFLDMACLTIWEDKLLDQTESDYIFALGRDLEKSEKEIQNALDFVTHFF